MSKLCTKVCVTGGSGYVGSYLVKKLLERGYIVHATLRNLEDKTKVGLLESLPNAEKQLFLFQADIYNPIEFEAAIMGCEYVFHVATPVQHDPTSTKYKDRIEATIDGARSIADSCIRSQTVKRLIYTASTMSASPLSENGGGFKSSTIDESCWSPYESLSLTHGNTAYVLDYIKAKTIAEKELLSYNDKEGIHLEVVSLPLGAVGGETILPYVPPSVQIFLSQISKSGDSFYLLLVLEELLGSIPFVHVDDVCEAHIFCMEKPSMKGRFICAALTGNTRDMADYFKKYHPDLKINETLLGDQERGTSCCSSKLKDSGFEYKYNLKEIMDDCVECAKRLGVLQKLHYECTYLKRHSQSS